MVVKAGLLVLTVRVTPSPLWNTLPGGSLPNSRVISCACARLEKGNLMVYKHFAVPRLLILALVITISGPGLFEALSDERDGRAGRAGHDGHDGQDYEGLIPTDCNDQPLNFSTGPVNARTGAPGELTCNLSLCHNSFLLNSGDGSFSLTIPAEFFPTDTVDIIINISDPGQMRWGFELTVLDSDTNPVGELIVADPLRTQISTDVGTGRQYLKHTAAGTNLGAVNVGPGWLVRWVSPFADVGPVFFYAAGNAANGNLLNSGDFIYTTSDSIQIITEGVRILADTTFGHDSLDVTFAPLTLQMASSWDWGFGDGNISALENPTHSYLAPGIFTVALDVQTNLGPFSWQVENLIGIEADSLIPLDTVGAGGAQATVIIYARNFLPLTRITLPLTWGTAPLDLALVSASVTGLRSAGMDISLLSINPFGKTAVYELVAADSGISPGAGPIVSLIFNVGAAPGGTVGQVNVVANSGFIPEFFSLFGNYPPDALSGTVTEFCCDTPGDANNSGSVNVSDVTFLIARIFAGSPAPDCAQEGDANGNGAINVSDITYLIARIFAGGSAPICGS